MIHYSCDVCGKPMPEEYQGSQKETRSGLEKRLLSIAQVDDVCQTCMKRGLNLSVPDLLLHAWRSLDAVQKQDDVIPEEPKVIRAHDLPELKAQKRKRPEQVVDKAAIRARVIEFRERNGLGCFDVLAEKTGKRGVSTGDLRNIAIGGAVLPPAKWLAVEKALDELAPAQAAEAKEGSDG